MTHREWIVASLSICFTVYMSSCGDNKRDILIELESTPINLPKNYSQKIDEQNGNMDVIGRSHKVLLFVDSIHCVTCNLKQIAFLHQTIQEDYHIPLWVIVASRKEDFLEVQHYVKSLESSIKVFMDTCNVFWKSNPQIPQEQSMHTFLLDSCNNVLVVGDPTRGKVKELYKKILQNSE